jgi:SagB-type dehydrogenase family enzyme
MSTLTLNAITDQVTLPPPHVSPTGTLRHALQHRHSSRAFARTALSPETLSALLWAGFGINRPATGHRTAPSAHNWQEIEIFVALANGTYRYDPVPHGLTLVKAEDLRGATGTQDFVATAPVNLVYVAHFNRMHEATGDERAFLAGADAAFIAQNINLFCANAGLATVVRGLIQRHHLAIALGLSHHERIVLAQSVGLPAAPG